MQSPTAASPITANATHALQQSHTSVRSYTNDPLSREVVEELIRTAQCAATSNFRQVRRSLSISRKLTSRKRLYWTALMRSAQIYVRLTHVSPIMICYLNLTSLPLYSISHSPLAPSHSLRLFNRNTRRTRLCG